MNEAVKRLQACLAHKKLRYMVQVYKLNEYCKSPEEWDETVKLLESKIEQDLVEIHATMREAFRHARDDP